MEKYGFIIGNWYKSTVHSSDYYIKIKNVEERTPTTNTKYRILEYNEKIQNNVHEFCDDYWANNDMETSALKNGIIDISEIEQFLPYSEYNPNKPIDDLEPLLKLLKKIQ